MAPVLGVTYYHLARREEQVMLARFGERYRRHKDEVPMLIPRRGDGRRGEAAGDREAAANRGGRS